jgi:predicted nuclease of predicted toxin-antitoxin system
MLRLLIDENLNHRILRGLKLRFSDLNYMLVPANLRGEEDSALIKWAAEQDRILVTHDLNTVPKFALERLRAGQPMVGIILIPGRLPIGQAIEELSILIECCQPADMRSLIFYLPL